MHNFLDSLQLNSYLSFIKMLGIILSINRQNSVFVDYVLLIIIIAFFWKYIYIDKHIFINLTILHKKIYNFTFHLAQNVSAERLFFLKVEM